MSHNPHHELSDLVEAAKKNVQVGGVYCHWRAPDRHYEVLAIAFCEWDEGVAVVYQQLGGPDSVVWVRRLHGEDGWLTAVLDDGVEIPRFQLVVN